MVTIQEFIARYKNHPVLFIGTGMSLRYLKNSYNWDGLLSKVAFELSGDREYYFDIKSKCHNNNNVFDYSKIGEILEKDFNDKLILDRNGKFKEINDIFYEKMANNLHLSRFKIYICKIFSELDYKEEVFEELKELKKTRKNIGSVITTNYDSLIENLFEFNKLIGNHILLSNPYGSVYKIHGCYENPEKVIITSEDYSEFNNKYELIRAQLLSLFIHNPIIFMGYSVNDDNIKKILKTIFTYVEPNTDLATTIKNNFLLIEREKDSNNEIISEHDIVLEGLETIRINKIKTDNYTSIYKSISNLQLPVTALDIRKVQNIVKEIYAGGDIKVNITEDLEALKNGDRILAIGSSKTIQYQYQTAAELLANYFNVIDESNEQILNLIDKYKIQPTQYFPIFAFSSINENINTSKELKAQQIKNIEAYIKVIPQNSQVKHIKVSDILDDNNISASYKKDSILWNTFQGNIILEEIEDYLRKYNLPKDTNFRKLLSVYDYKKYN